jgi:hypothetical protein
MNEEDVVKFVSEAVNTIENVNSHEERLSGRAKLARWLRKKYNIAIKEMRVNVADGAPYLVVEYLNEHGETKECLVNVKKWEANFV